MIVDVEGHVDNQVSSRGRSARKSSRPPGCHKVRPVQRLVQHAAWHLAGPALPGAPRRRKARAVCARRIHDVVVDLRSSSALFSMDRIELTAENRRALCSSGLRARLPGADGRLGSVMLMTAFYAPEDGAGCPLERSSVGFSGRLPTHLSERDAIYPDFRP